MNKLFRHKFARRKEGCFSTQFKWFYKHTNIRNMSVLLEKPTNVDQTQRTELPLNIELPKTSSFFSEKLSHFSWLHSAAPGFAVNGDNISIIHEPSKFYDVLLEKCQTAKRRITLASLYLGTGPLEEKLVTAIDESLQAHKGILKVKVLLDFTRGSRGKMNSRQMLLPLIRQHESSCQVSLYHTPALRGLLRNVQRYNELVGLQHMKLYIIDDSLLISGANLSSDYFTNRQDRYFLIEDCGRLADFYDALVSRVSEFSLLLDAKDNVGLHPGWTVHPTRGSAEEFRERAYERVAAHLHEATRAVDVDDAADTWVFPLVQMGQLGVTHDCDVTTRLLEAAEPESEIHLATGYFNLTAQYVDSIVNRSRASYNILMAHPNANGFLNAKGPAYGIPYGYTIIANSFLSSIHSANQNHRIAVTEYQRPGWTYHAKGLWLSLPGESTPSLTLVGSPNFGGRSACRDLETQVAIATKNTRLRRRLHEEQTRLYDLGSTFTRETIKEPQRRPPLWTRFVVGLFRDVF